MKEIGATLDLSESRVSQMHSSILMRLKAQIADRRKELAQVAAVTSTITIGTLVLSHAFRHVVQLAREASALAASSAGRFVLGLGSGWHQPEFDSLGLPFDHRVGRLEEAFEPLSRLLHGEHVTAHGTWLRLDDAAIAVTSAAPPLWIAAEGPRMIALAARAEGWNHAYWGAEDTTRFETALRALQGALALGGRKRAEVETSASIAWNEPARTPSGVISSIGVSRKSTSATLSRLNVAK